jgi:uncharacterized cupin superfamily protein/nucleoside-diphosphate-sugar epimerase
MDATSPLVIFGCGYVGTRLADAALKQGRVVRACSRGIARLQPLADRGAQLHFIDATRVKQFGPALQGMPNATVVYSIPPLANIPAGESVRRAAQAALQHGAHSFIYLGTAGVYGNTADPEWVDEKSTVALDDGGMAPRHSDEAAVQSANAAGLRTTILRLAAIYGPGRGVRQRLRKGDYKLVDDGVNWISRIHVDDLVRVIFAVEDRAPPGSMYLVSDDLPTQQKEYAAWLCERLGLPLPRSVPAYGPGVPRTFQRGRRLRNDLMKSQLGITLKYPSYREGEAQIEAEEAGVAAASPAPEPIAAVQQNAPIPVAETPKPPRPETVRHFSELPSLPTGAGEKFGEWKSLARPMGLARLGVLHVALAPGERSALPHAHSAEEEFVYILDGTPDLLRDGTTWRLAPGDVVAIPAGTGVAHSFVNNTPRAVTLLVVGESREGDKVSYPNDTKTVTG